MLKQGQSDRPNQVGGYGCSCFAWPETVGLIGSSQEGVHFDHGREVEVGCPLLALGHQTCDGLAHRAWFDSVAFLDQQANIVLLSRPRCSMRHSLLAPSGISRASIVRSDRHVRSWTS